MVLRCYDVIVCVVISYVDVRDYYHYYLSLTLSLSLVVVAVVVVVVVAVVAVAAVVVVVVVAAAAVVRVGQAVEDARAQLVPGARQILIHHQQ